MLCVSSSSPPSPFPVNEAMADISEHSHEIGPANLPFTRRGRKAQAEKSRSRGRTSFNSGPPEDTDQSSTPPAIHNSLHMNAIAGPSNAVQQPMASTSAPTPTVSPLRQPQPHTPHPPPPQASPQLQHPQFQHAVSMTAPLPPPPPPPTHMDMSQERWDRMSVLFQTIRDRARGFEYPGASVAALESVLIRLYLESPVAGGMGGPPQSMAGMPLNGMGDTVGT